MVSDHVGHWGQGCLGVERRYNWGTPYLIYFLTSSLCGLGSKEEVGFQVRVALELGLAKYKTGRFLPMVFEVLEA